MPEKKLPLPPGRKPRADAQRNRARILEVAKEVFTRDGAAASLDDIARQSGIGPGTLYRHFPTRDTLIEAVYRNEVEKLAGAAQRFAAKMPPLAALRAWMLLFIDHVADKRLIIPAMDTVAGGSSRLIEGARGLIHGVFFTTALPGWESSARRLVDILIAGSSATRKHPSTAPRMRQK
jgi:AcrR family transcriptional regulator